MGKAPLLGVALTIVFGPVAWGHDLLPAPWRGDDRTTFQHWTFDTAADPALPDFITNPGTSSADIELGDFASGWIDELPGFGTQYGYWDIGQFGSITMDIDNYPEPLDYKEVWVQVTYFESGGFYEAPSVDVPDAQFVSSEATTIENDPTGGSWILERTLWRLMPNPPHEQVIVSSGELQAVIDQIVVDTICAPEPTALLLLAPVLLMVARKRC